MSSATETATATATPKPADDVGVEGMDQTEATSPSSPDMNLNLNSDNNKIKINRKKLKPSSSSILFDGISCRSFEAPEPTLPSTTQDEEETRNLCCRISRRMCQFYWNNDFACSVVVVVLLAWIYPPLGADYLAPEITSTWIAVMVIFIISGLGLETEQMTKSVKLVRFNTAVQVFSFGVCSSIVFGVSRVLAEVIPGFQTLADGMVVCSCLPMTINCAIILTQTAHGDEAASIFNSALGNIIGIFLTPVLILGYLGVSGETDIAKVFYKLCLRVVVPFAIGQALHIIFPVVVAFSQKYKTYFKLTQMYALTYIVFCTFSTTFQNRESSDNPSGLVEVLIMIAVQFSLLCTLMVLSWFTFRFLFRDHPTLRAMALFGSTHKTIAMGVPLIASFYEGNPQVGIYTLPLLVWHPMQLLIGSFVAARLASWVDSEVERLGLAGDVDCDEELKIDETSTEDQKSDSLDEEAPAAAAAEEIETFVEKK